MDLNTTSLLAKKEKLEFLSIIQKSIKVAYKNPYFIIFTLLTSLPLFYSMLIYETISQRTLVEASIILNRRLYDISNGFDCHYELKTDVDGNSILTCRPFTVPRERIRNLLRVGFVYLVPVFVSELFTIAVTVVLASKIYRGDADADAAMSLKEMIVELLRRRWWDSSSITAIYVHLFSTCILLGLIWLLTTFYFIFIGYFFAPLFAMAFLLLLQKYLEWSSEWNMGIVISVLEGDYGAQALEKSADFGKGRERCGFLLMLVFFVWGSLLRSASLFFGWYEGGRGIILLAGLLCLGNVMKWVACTVYFHDCEARVLEKKFDGDVEGDIENVKADETSKDDMLMKEGRV